MVADARPGDSAGITGTPAVLPLALLAAHPRNPRGNLGDLTELTASISAHGVFEPLVVITALAYAASADADGDPERPGGEFTHVIVMGHRRAAAARAAGLAEVPVVVRDDLAGAPAIAAMIAENLHREGLTPLAEASAMAELARRSWSQRRIAEEIGCSQAHVSKRLSLLQLPKPARDALAADQMSVGDALELHRIASTTDDDVAAQVIGRAVADIGSGHRAGNAIAQARQDALRAQAAKKTRADLEARGITIITRERRARMGWPRVWDRDIGPHEEGGCLVAEIGWSGEPEWACTNPASHPDAGTAARARARENDDEQESRKAAKARDAACLQIAAGPLPELGGLARMLAGTLLAGTGHSESLRLACKWLRDAGIAPGGVDHYAWRNHLEAAGDHAGLAQYAYAYALAADEQNTCYRREGWDGRQAAHLARLVTGGYQPTAWEQARLNEVRQVDAARGTLTCPDCGCTGAPAPAGCDVTFDREADKPAYKCRWDCPAHRGATSREPVRADGPDDTEDDAADDAPPGPAAGRDLAAPSAPRGSVWTPDLRAALEELMPKTATPA